MCQQIIEQENPLISVIVPIYKVEAYLEQCLDSILRQTWKNLDIFLIDDGSPDACGQICDLYAEKDPRIRVFHTENRGLSAARNLGIEKAKETESEFLIFVDSDDWLEDNMIEVLAKTAVQNNADVVICGEYNDFPGKTTIRRSIGTGYSGEQATKAILAGKILNHVMSKIWRKDCFSRIAFPEGRVYEDLATVYKVFAECTYILIIKDVLYHYRNRNDSIVHIENLKNIMDRWLAVRERYEYCASHPVFAKDKVLRDSCKRDCIDLAKRLWRMYYGQSCKERKFFRTQYIEISKFVKNNMPLFGEKRWPLILRVGSFLAHSATGPSFAAAYVLSKLRQRKGKRKEPLFGESES